MNERIKTIESAGEDTDFYDGMIMNAYENDMDVSTMDIDTLSALYGRAVYYLDILKYKDKPNEDSDKYAEANNLNKKLKMDVDVEWLKKLVCITGKVLISRS